VDGDVLGKPASAGEARDMLRRLGGRVHEVITGVAVVEMPGGVVRTGVARTLVSMRVMSDGEIDAYVAGGEPMDKAGGYGIQGTMAPVVERIEGCYFNVVGLPLSLVARLLRR
jgi:septum formation protein